MIDAQAFAEGKAPALTARAVKSWAMSVATKLFRDYEKDDQAVRAALDEDRILNAKPSQISDNPSLAEKLPEVKERIAELAADLHRKIAPAIATCASDKEINALLYASTQGYAFKAVAPLGNLREESISRELDRKAGRKQENSAEFKRVNPRSASKAAAVKMERSAAMSR